MKTTVITGINGMDGSYLAEKLLAKGHRVIGIDRWFPTGDSPNLVNIINNKKLEMITGDICESEFITRLIKEYQPDYFYNMASISLVPESFKIPITVFKTNTLAVIYQLEAIRTHSTHTRYYFAATSEMIGDNTLSEQNTESKMRPNSPYSIAKLASYHMVRMYRHAFGLFTVNGMLWNHESERRGPIFVTRKVSLHIGQKIDEVLQIGNLNANRDWGRAQDFCDAMILMLEADEPDDYSVNTGETHTIRELIEEAYNIVGLQLTWKGTGKDEKGYDQSGKLRVEVNPKLFRPMEVPYLHGDHNKIKNKLGWTPKTKFKELIKIMVEHDKKRN